MKPTPLPGITTFGSVSTTPAGEVKISAASVRNMAAHLTADKALALAAALTEHALAIKHPDPVTEGTTEALASRISPDAARKAVANCIAHLGSRQDWGADELEIIPMFLSGLLDGDNLPDWTDQDNDAVKFWGGLEFS